MRARLIRGAALALGLAALAATPAGAAPATTGPQGIHSGGPSTVVLDPLPVPTIHVSPRRGTKRTRFVVDYRPASGLPTAGSVGYLVSAYGPRHRGCVSRVLLPPTPLEGGALERARLAPPRHSGGWCTGLYRGSVRRLVTPNCGGPPMACPMILSAEETVARFSFRVRR